jgi:putative drug exporter of the RND superfamily
MLHRALETWGKSLHRFRWIIILIWIVLISVSGWLVSHYSSVLSGGGWDIPKSESLKVQQLLVEEFDGRSETSLLLIFQDRAAKAGDPAYQDKLTKMIDYIGKEDGVESTYSLLNAAESMKPRMVSDDGHTTYAFVNMNVDEDYAVKLMPGVQKRYVEYAEENGVKSYLTGNSALWGDIAVYSQEGLKRAEMIVFPLIFIILLFVFRSIVAAITPILITVAGVASGMGVIYLVGSQVEMSVFVTNSAMMLGLGIGIDYSLFMVSRFRQELAKHKDINQAMGITMRTSGHTILFSGITVFAAMIALFVINVPAIQAIAFGAISVLVFAVLATLSLLPAVLTLLGERINKGRIPNLFYRDRKRTSLWVRFVNLIMKRPVLFLLVSIILMGIFAIPVRDMKLTANDASILPVESGVRLGLEMYTDSFSTGGTTINSIIVSSDEGRITDQPYLSYLGALQEKLMEQENIKQVSSIAGFVQGMDPQQASAFLNSDPEQWPSGLKPMIDRYISRDGQTAVLDMTFLTDGSSEASQMLMEDIRRKIVPDSEPPAHLSFAFGGNTPRAADMNQAIDDGLLPALFIMLGLTFLILIATFRSILLPLKAILMNLLSVGATFGIVTWVFASGHGVEIFGAEANGSITNFVPLLMLALLFGLSTDYEVFLVSRMKEHYEETGNNEESIKVGIQSTGPLITGAAVLMIAVFTGFAFSSMLPIQTLGFGLAVAILLDSTIVRMIIVPAAMKLLGHLNWWYPGNKAVGKKHGNDDQI